MDVVHPSAGMLWKLKHEQQTNDGDCVTMYENQIIMRGNYKEEIVQLMCNQIKLQENVYIIMLSNEMAAVTEDFVCKRKN